MRCLVSGAGGFIGGHLVQYLLDRGNDVVAVDRKPIPEWYQVHSHANNLCLDLTDHDACARVCEGVDEVYQLAADMGGMGYIERYRIECMRSIFINTNMLETAYRAGVKRYFYSSSACVYPAGKQDIVNPLPLKESDAIPAESERGYGWEKLYSEMACQEYWAERGLETHIARFFNIAGPCFDDITEVLTNSGWKVFADLTPDDLIAARTKDGEMEYTRIMERQTRYYEGPMYLVQHTAMDQCVTPDHAIFATWPTTRHTSDLHIPPFARHVVKNTKWNRAKMRFTSYSEWAGVKHPSSFAFAPCKMTDGRNKQSHAPIDMGDWFEFIGWYLSEGSAWITKGGCYSVCISQKDPLKRKQILQLIQRMGYRVNLTQNGIVISNKQLFEAITDIPRGAKNKRIPRWMLGAEPKLLSRLFSSLMAGDGDADGSRYSSISYRLADDVMELALKLGYHAWIGVEPRRKTDKRADRNPATWNDIYRVHISKKCREIVTKREHRTTIQYSGMVYDVTLEQHHVMMVRRNGKPIWSGNCGTWCGGREKAPAAICRKVIEAKDTGIHEIEIWGDGEQTRDFTWIGDCCQGIDKIIHCDKLIATPCNLGSDEVVTINQLVTMAEEIGGVTLERKYDLKAPQGVRGRNSDNTFIRDTLGWEPKTPLRFTMERVYEFVKSQYMAQKAGKRVVA